jgi:hypothetical protein
MHPFRTACQIKVCVSGWLVSVGTLNRTEKCIKLETQMLSNSHHIFLKLFLSTSLLLASFGLAAENINVGGPEFTDGNGVTFTADQPYAAGSFGYVSSGGGTNSTSADIAGTTEDTVYQTLRGNTSFSYLFDGLAPGTYDVTLYFTETYWTSGGQRLFDVDMEGTQVLNNFDIFSAAGGQLTAYSQTFTVDVLDGQLNIDFTASLRIAMVSGISVTPQIIPVDPDIEVTPSSLDFNETLIGGFADIPVTISNNGSQPLTISDLSTTNPNYTIIAPATPFDVATLSDQVITARFSPTGSGTQSGDILITSNDPDSGLLSVPVTGSGVTSITRAMNAGGSDYTDSNGVLFSADAPFVAGGNGYTATDGGVATYTQTVAGTADQAIYQSLRGSNSMSYNFDSLSPGMYDVTLHFMEPIWNDPGERTFNVDIEGSQVLTNFDIAAAAGSSFTAYSQTFTVDVSDGQLNVDFTGVFRLALVSGVSVSLSQPAPDIDAPTSVDFGSVTVGTIADSTVTLSNIGTETLSVSSLSVSDATYSIISPVGAFDIAAGGGTQDVVVRFSPTTETTTAANLNVASNDPDENPFVIALTGTGAPAPLNEPDISLDTASIDFGAVLVGSSAQSSVTISNIGLQTLSVSDLTAGGAFSVISPATPFDVASGASQVVTLSFDPIVVGAEAGSLDITSNDPDTGVASVALAGTGTLTIESGLSVGGGEYTDPNGVVYSADQAYVSGSFGYIATDGGTATYTEDIAGTTDDALYQSVRAGSAFSYLFDNMASGKYEVTLHFMEPYWSSAGQRLFNVAIEGTQVLTDFDIFAAAGGQFVAYSETFAVDVTDGQLSIDFVSVLRFAMVSGITIKDLGIPIVPKTYSNVAANVGLVLSHDLGTICNPVIGSGSAWADYDNDGDIDLFVTNRGGANRLYRNDGDTSGDGLPDFVDEAASRGVDDPTGAGHGTVFVDYDNDGDQDLFVANWGANKLFQNQLQESGTVSFTDVTATAGVADFGRTITASFADYDGDGYLDLYLTKHKQCGTNDNSRDTLYHSNGDGTFSDVTALLCSDGTSSCQAVSGLGFSPRWFDFDNDNDLDLYLVNDDINGVYTPNVLWRNDGSDGAGGWTFTDISAASGTDISLNGMGQGIGDYDNDGWLDTAFSNIGANWLMRNNGDGTFTDTSANAGIQRATFPNGERNVTWATSFFDYDNDGWLDLYYVAGETALFAYEQPNSFFENNRDGTFTDISVASGLDDPGRGRNSSMADFDGDGFVDIFVGNYGTAPALFRNNSADQGNTNNWLSVTVEGTVSNRDGIGTRLTLTTPDGVSMMREIDSGPAHGGGDYRAAYFGMGTNATGELTVRWPTGVTQVIGTVNANQAIQLVE